jgi:N-acetylglucosamine kinase-like BadF-type ATPase
MNVIIESGATKGDWRIVSPSGEEFARFLTGGTNVSTMTMEAVKGIVIKTCDDIVALRRDIENIFLYTAGIPTPEIKMALTDVFKEKFPGAKVEIKDDLIAAARAACGHDKGVVAILGTGSNSCLWDGEKIVKRIRTGGFILGDEGSASALGKAFIADFIKDLVPENVSADFREKFDSSYESIVENVYRSQTSPSGYLGSFTPFIMQYYETEPYIKALVDNNFRSFIKRVLKQYGTDAPVGIIGGFGCALKDIFTEIAQEEGISISGFLGSPIEGLIKYHRS